MDPIREKMDYLELLAQSEEDRSLLVPAILLEISDHLHAIFNILWDEKVDGVGGTP
jgi:hypothetical protein